MVSGTMACTQVRFCLGLVCKAKFVDSRRLVQLLGNIQLSHSGISIIIKLIRSLSRSPKRLTGNIARSDIFPNRDTIAALLNAYRNHSEPPQSP